MYMCYKLSTMDHGRYIACAVVYNSMRMVVFYHDTCILCSIIVIPEHDIIVHSYYSPTVNVTIKDTRETS